LYIGTFFIFTILMIPAAMTNSLPGLLVLRFLGGWFGKCCSSDTEDSVQLNAHQLLHASLPDPLRSQTCYHSINSLT
jgi:hypothetical protein